MKRFLITGGSGSIATAIRPALAAAGWAVRLLDRVEPGDALRENEEFLSADLADRAALVGAFHDVDVVVHLGGFSTERGWQDIVSVNISGTQAVLEAAQNAGVRTVLLASSVHAVGCATAGDARANAVVPPRPDTFYGVGKVAMEALGSVYADRYGMSIVSARIGNFAERPDGHRGLAFWLSTDDMVRLVFAVAALERPGHHIVWAVSANRRGWVRPDAGDEIGFHPLDDAEAFADETTSSASDQPVVWDTSLAGGFVSPTRRLGVPWK